MRRSRVASLSVTVAFLALAACSSSHSASPVTTTIAAAPPGSSSTLPPNTLPPNTVAPTTAPVGADVRIISLSGPPGAVLCNAPTQVELHWVTQHAKTVTLQINGGPVFSSYPGGKSDELVPLACDGNAQTYLLTAHAPNGKTISKSLTVHERESSPS
jgi:hypothetical protein